MQIEVNGARLFVDVDGARSVPAGAAMVERPVLFVLHGGPGADHSYFKPWLDALTGVAQLVYVDHRGNGRSERTGTATYTMTQMADDLEELRKLLGYERIQVLGHSFGGMVALTYALRHPDHLAGLIACTTAASYEFRAEAWEIAAARATPEQLKMLPRLFDGVVATEAEHDEWWRVCLPLYFHRPDATVCAELLGREHAQLEVVNYMMASQIPAYDVSAQLAAISAPTLVVSGRYDWVTPVSQGQVIASGIPGAALAVFEDSGHFPFIEEHDRFLHVIGDFVGTADGPGHGGAGAL
jgi:proline iminopeptidase